MGCSSKGQTKVGGRSVLAQGRRRVDVKLGL